MLSDRGTNFLSKLVAEVCKIFQIQKVNTSSYHPQTDGPVERFNSTLCQSLSIYVAKNQKDWDDFRILKQSSPVHYRLRSKNNKKVTFAVHANRMKPFVDPALRPIEPPIDDDPSEPYLDESDIPADSFEVSELSSHDNVTNVTAEKHDACSPSYLQEALDSSNQQIKVFFHNKGIDNVKLTSILHNKLVRSKVPIYFQEQDPPLVSYKYTNNISRSVFNYYQTLRNINLDDYHNASSSCDCESSTFRYEPHGHVITGDLRIVRNRKLRRLLEKGPKYREQNVIDWKLNKKILLTAIDDYARNWSKREGYHVSALEEWSETVKLISSNRIQNLQHRNFSPCQKILEDPHIKTYLTELQSKYVLVPADKAGNNIIFVCKYYYIRTLMEELGINSGTNLNSTYINQANTVDELIQTHATTLADVFNIKLQQKEKNLPQIYWIPKLHKTPYKARFIAGSCSCTTTRLSKLITECLKLVRSHCTAYCKTIRERTGVNSMWIINNSLDVIRTLEEKQLSLTHVSTWDFSTLYTSLPHARLKNQLHDLLERVFHTKGKSFIATNSFRTFWTNDRTSMRYTYLSCRELCLAIDFLIDNIYVRFESSVFRQVIGIPMGTNSAPLLADLFLHTFEYDFMVKTMKHDITKAIQFSNTFRYIDDLFSINNVDFGNYISAIYPPELQLTDTSTSSTEVCFLDAHIKTGDSTTPFRISIYDKRDDFTFRIVNFPHIDSNIPANPAYGVYISQLVRYARICTSKVDFMNRLRGLSLRLRQQGFLTNLLQRTFTKFFNRHGLIVVKYGATLREMRFAIQA